MIRSGSLTAQATYYAVNAANLVDADGNPITATVKENGIEGESEVTITAENVKTYSYIATGRITGSAT